MKWSQTFIPTLKESPKEAEIASHQLMLRAGYIQSLSSGLYIYLPLGKKVLDKLMALIRKTLDGYGAIELSMPALQPRAIWEKSGRWDLMADLMMRLKDREDREFVLGPTHEEIITDLVSKRVNSYRQLPLNFYQIQTKFRDEIRPRFGVIRAKEFIMKDAYSFDLTEEKANESYWKMYEAYTKIFKSAGIRLSAVEADTGVMGDGGRSHEFMAVSAIGEDVIVFCEKCGYSSNMETAQREPQKVEQLSTEDKKPLLIDTPGIKTVEEVSTFFKVQPSNLIKTLIYQVDESFVAVLIRGDFEVNEIKLKRALKNQNVRLAEAQDIKNITKAETGFAGPIGLSIPIIADSSITDIQNGITGANQTDKHYQNVTPGKDFSINETHDIGFCKEGDICKQCGENLSFGRGIEVGQVFYLGKKYTEKLGASVIDADGKSSSLIMGCYGIGVSRTLAAVIECNHDEKGIIWPITVAPYEVVLTPLDMENDQIRSAALTLYQDLSNIGVDVLLDDRNERPGFKFKDADLIGIPLRITIGMKSLAEGHVEFYTRSENVTESISLSDACEIVQRRIKDLKNKLETV